MFNFDVAESSVWKRVQIDHCPPICMPAEIAHVDFAWKVTGYTWPLKSCVRDGTLKLRAAEVRSIVLAIGFQKPKKPGSGKKRWSGED